MFQYYFKYCDTVSYRDIFGSDTQYYYLVVSHIPNSSLAGGSLYTHSGGGANYLCLPEDHNTLPMEFLITGHNTNILVLPHMITMFHVLFVILLNMKQNY